MSELFSCPEIGCHYTSTKKKTMSTHIRGKHDSTTKIHHCPVESCFYSTTRSHDMKKHSRAHDMVYPYKCDQCESYSVATRSAIYVHYRARHPSAKIPYRVVTPSVSVIPLTLPLIPPPLIAPLPLPLTLPLIAPLCSSVVMATALLIEIESIRATRV